MYPCRLMRHAYCFYYYAKLTLGVPWKYKMCAFLCLFFDYLEFFRAGLNIVDQASEFCRSVQKSV